VPSGVEQVECILCGHSSPQALASVPDSPAHSPDLDLRPSGPARRHLAGWVQRCPACGYCSAALDAPPEGVGIDAARSLVSAERYTATLGDARYPPLANSFRALALLQGAAENPLAADLAALSLLYAAWACDDAAESQEDSMLPAQAQGQARGLRRNAAEQLRGALEAGRAPAVDPPTSWLVLADCYRRAEAFPSAHTASIRGLAALAAAEDPQSVVLRILLEFEQQLVEVQDVGAVNMAQAFEETS
jgi:hypothetical protein